MIRHFIRDLLFRTSHLGHRMVIGNVLVLQISQPEFYPQNPQWKRESLQKGVLQLHMPTTSHTQSYPYMYCAYHDNNYINFVNNYAQNSVPQTLSCVLVTIIKHRTMHVS